MAIFYTLLLVVIYSIQVRSTGEEYTGYIKYKFNDQNYCLVTVGDETETTGYAAALYGPTQNQTDIFQNCEYWIVRNATDPEDDATAMTLRTADDRALYIQAIVDSGFPVELNGLEGSQILFVKDNILNEGDLHGFLNEAIYLKLVFPVDFRGYKGLCFGSLPIDLGENIFPLKLTLTGRVSPDYCIADGEWNFEPFSYCSDFPCENDGICVNDAEADDYICQCTDDFGGKNCQLENPCNTSPCNNEGTCSPTEDFTDYRCTCPIHFFGKDCETVDPCKDRDCTCSAIADGLDYTCVCLDMSNHSWKTAQCGKNCTTDCKLGCIGTQVRNGKVSFDVCSLWVISMAKRRDKHLTCCRDRCTAMKTSDIELCESCHQLDCVEISIYEESCGKRPGKNSSSSGSASSSHHGGYGGNRGKKSGRRRGHNRDKRWSKNPDKLWGQRDCKISSNVTICIVW